MDDKLEEKKDEDTTLGEASPIQPETNPEPQTQTPPENETEGEPYPDKNPYINTTSPYTTSGMPSKRRNPKKLLLILGAIVVLLLLGNFVRGKIFKSSPAATPTPTPVATETPSPSPEESSSPSASPTATPKAAVNSVDKASGLDRANLSVAIQNGSGESGVAGTASTFLTGLGYNVTSTGNADNFNFTGVTVQVKSSKSDFLSLLKKDLSTKYTVSSATSDLSATSSADALVIIGK
ncbi:MAG TPA: LytR C-terminal domain-containing protein [Patescibacteria group bacterium]|nr:LytR C-terminal domain-containing protein [Patescibacteria group bacterium]